MGLLFGPRIGEMAGFVMAWIVPIFYLWLALGISSGAGAALRPVVQVPVADASGAAAVEIVRGSDLGGGIGGILYTGGPGDAMFNHYNSRGDVVGQTDGGGSVTWEAAYEGFGKRTAQDGTATGRQRANTKDEDVTGLLNEGHRYRCLETGVFITRDPAGFVDGPNVYSYVVQNPWSRFDTDGQFWSAVVTAGFAIYDTYRYATGKTTGKQYAKAMALNAAALVADVATVGNGGGMAIRAANATVRVAKAVDKANTAYETASSVVENGEALGNAISTGDVRGVVRATVSLGVDAAGGKKTGKADVPGGSSAQHTKEAADDAAKTEALFEHNGQVFHDVNPTARPAGSATQGRPPGGLIEPAHAEVGAMWQSELAGNRGGVGRLYIEGQAMCGWCKGDVKTRARQMKLDELHVEEAATGKNYFFDREGLLKGSAGRSWKDAEVK
jgi:RHS repeat-associated protein